MASPVSDGKGACFTLVFGRGAQHGRNEKALREEGRPRGASA